MFSPSKLYIISKLCKVPVAEIDQTDIRDTLTPICHTKAETSKKAMNRLWICMKHAAALGLDVDLQAAEPARDELARGACTIYAGLPDGSIAPLRLFVLTVA